MKPALVALTLVAIAAPAAAQEASEVPGDWDLVREGLSVSAILRFEPAPNFIVRCSRDRLDVLITGLPPTSADTTRRPVDMRWGEGEAIRAEWTSLSPDIIGSRFPAWSARMLKQGGALRMIVRPAQEQPGNQYRLDIPPSPNAIDEVLKACHRPLEDEADDQMAAVVDPSVAAELEWARRPEPEFPQAAQRAGVEQGSAQLLCQVRPNGRFSTCEITSEFPSGVGFGAAALVSVRNARLASASAAPPEGQAFRLVAPVLRFQVR